MVFNIFAFAASAVQFIFTSQSLIAAGIRFIGGSIISQLLAGGSSQEGPRLSDLRVQVSSYGNPIPRIYGEGVRIAGNVIDKSDLIETRHKKKKKILGFTVASQKYYTYSAHLAVLLAEGELPEDALRRVYANGKVIFDRDAVEATPPSSVGGLPGLGKLWNRQNKTNALFKAVRFYPGNATQEPDELLESLHPGEPVPAYRHSAYVVIEDLQLADFGNGVPNLEFELETNYTTVAAAVEHIGSFADVDIVTHALHEDSLRGYVVAQAGSVWSAIEPLAGTFSFDLIAQGASFRAVTRGRYMRAVLPVEAFAARPPGEGPREPVVLTREDANSYPDEVTISYMDVDRDYQPGTQRAFRNEGYSKNKINVELSIVLNAEEARQAAGRTLYEGLSKAGATTLYLSDAYRWLGAGDVVGVPISGQIHPFRIAYMTRSPNGVIETKGVFEDALNYTGDIPASSGSFTPGELSLPGDTIMQPMDAPVLEDETDPGFYFATTGTGSGWRGCEIYRAEGIGSPLTYELIIDPGIGAVIGDVVGTLGAGPTDVVDWANELEVQLFGVGELETVTEDDVLARNANFAWVGAPDGQGGEYINFVSAVPGGSPETWTLTGLLRGRRGTEHAVASHGAGERFVLIEADPVGRLDFGLIDWNVPNTYLPVSVYQDQDDATPQEFTNTGECRRPYSPVHLRGTRNDANDDVLIEWTRRTRLRTPQIGAGVPPLGEDTEEYDVEIYGGSPLAVVRSLTVSTPEYNYDEAAQTADGHTLGDPVRVDVYQVSASRGRGHVASGTV